MHKPLILVLNKIDLISQRTLDAWVEYFGRKYPAMRVVPFSSFPNKDTVVFAGDVEEVRRVRADELKPSTKQPTPSPSSSLSPAPRQTHVKQERMAEAEARSGQSQRLPVKPHGVAELMQVVESIAAELKPASADERIEPPDEDSDGDSDDDADADAGAASEDANEPAAEPKQPTSTERERGIACTDDDGHRHDDAAGPADVAGSCMYC